VTALSNSRLQPLHPLQLLPLHPLLHSHPFRYNTIPHPLDLPTLQPTLPQLPQRLPLHNAVLTLILPVKAKRLSQTNWRVRNDPRHPQRIITRRMQHQWMQQIHVADLPRRLHKPLLFTLLRELIKPTQPGLLLLHRRIQRARRHARRHALRMHLQMPRDPFNSPRAQHGAAAGGADIGKQRDDQQGLLGRVQIMDEEVAVDVPAEQLFAGHRLALARRRAQVDDERVPPRAATRADPRRAAQQLADPCPRLGRECRDRECLVPWHVDPLAGPGRLVGWRHAEPRPDGRRDGRRLLAREARWQLHPAV